MKITAIQLIAAQDLTGAVEGVTKQATDTNHQLHVVACSLLQHAQLHGDYTLITRLCDGLPKGVRVKALAFWFGQMSNGRIALSIDPETKSYRVNKEKFKARSDADFALDRAMEVSFDELTAEKDPNTLTIERFLKSLKRTATNAENFDGTDIPKVAPAVRALASALVKNAEDALAQAKQPAPVAQAA